MATGRCVILARQDQFVNELRPNGVLRSWRGLPSTPSARTCAASKGETEHTKRAEPESPAPTILSLFMLY
jgi:hypothetical protein